MNEDVNKHMQPGDILKAFIENRYGPKVYEAYSAAIDSGEIATNEDAVAFLDKKTRTIEGKLLTEPQLERHDEKVIDEIRLLLGEKKGIEVAKYLEGKLVGLAKYFGVKTELDHESSKESGKRLTKKSVEELLKQIYATAGIIGRAVGYSEPEYIEGTGIIKRKLNLDYFTGLIVYITTHGGADAKEQIAQLKQLEENLSQARQANKGMEQAKIELVDQNANLVNKLESLSKEHGELENEFSMLRAAAVKYHTFAFDDVKQIIDETKQGGKKNGR